MIKRPLHLSHDFLAEVLDDGAVAVDATMGNGNDTAFLAQHAKKVYAFDVQEQALKSTQERLEKQVISNAQLILDGHQNLDKYVNEPIRAAIFNLGYLPSADKTVITKPDTTLVAIEKILERLEIGGRLAIMIYMVTKVETWKKMLCLFTCQLLTKKSLQPCFTNLLTKFTNHLSWL